MISRIAGTALIGFTVLLLYTSYTLAERRRVPYWPHCYACAGDTNE